MRLNTLILRPQLNMPALKQTTRISRQSHRRRHSAVQCVLEGLESRQLLSAFHVTSEADSGPGSLRDAILAANATPGADTIDFDFATLGGGVLIQPESPLPAIADPLTIDATTHPAYAGAPLVRIDGAMLASSDAVGLTITAGGSVLRGLSFSNWQDAALLLTGPGGNTVQDNHFGLDGPNGVTAVRITGNVQSTGSQSYNRLLTNVISGNFNDGIQILNASSGTTIQGNLIGLDPTGNAPLGNLGHGILIQQSAAPVNIGGNAAADRNIIASSGGDGIRLEAASNVAITGNFIGTDRSGTAPMVIGGTGLTITPDSSNISIAHNVISSCEGDGIRLGDPGPLGQGTSAGALMPGILITGNYVGTDVSGEIALPNDGNGITAWVSGVTIGGPTENEANIISANYGHGIYLRGHGNTVLGNLIGASADGSSPLGNRDSGIWIDGNDNRIGGAWPDALNHIAHNGNTGVTVHSGAGNAIRANSIHDNTGLGIDLGANGVTENDPLDADTGPNLYQNFPVLDSATLADGVIKVVGSLNAQPSKTYTIEFFANASADPSGYGEGHTYLGKLTVTTDAAGKAIFTATLALLPAAQELITATATDAANNTSEFSKPVKPTLPPPTPQPGPFVASGLTLRDLSGNGLTADDVPLGNVTVSAYQDRNANGVLDRGDGAPIATTISDATTGAYSFILTPGVYFVEETVPTSYIRTWPALSSYYVVNAVADASRNDLHFDNYRVCSSCFTLDNVYFTINGSTVVTDLRGNVHEGDNVVVTFTVPDGHNPTVSFVVYTAPGSSFDPDNADEQRIIEVVTGKYPPGTHTMQVNIPDCYFQVDFVCGKPIDQFGPAGSNIFYTPQGRLLSADNGGSRAYNPGSSFVSGYVYVDANNNGVQDTGEQPLRNVAVTLTGNGPSRTSLTDARGRYVFANVPIGDYQITQTQPDGYADGIETLGSGGGAVVNNAFAITIGSPAIRAGYNFGETRITATPSGYAATLGFWTSSKGQSLIRSFNGRSSSSALANWLTRTFPRLYGTGSRTSLANGDNADVADLIKRLATSSSTKPEASFLAVALSVYATTSSLGGNAAAAYGFAVSNAGAAQKPFNVGSNGAAFGVANNTTLTLRQLLDAAHSQANNGTLYSRRTSLRPPATNVFDAIARQGGIV